MIHFSDQITGLVYGLAFGDGIASPSATNRLSILAPKRIMRMRSLLEYADENKQTTRPIPYTHAQPGNLLHPTPSDDTEWFIFALDYLLQGEDSLKVWQALAAKNDDIRARTGMKIALKNLANGALPPYSGHDNPHYFDDIALVRSIAIAITHYSRGEDLLKKIEEDISITHSEDGVYCARATAQLFAAILTGKDKSEAISQALQQLPPGSWSERLVLEAIERSAGIANAFERAMNLEESYIENIYAYPISAPETLGLLLAHFANSQGPEELVNSSLLHKRKLDSLPPLAGALAGVAYGASWLPSSAKSASITLGGVCLPALKGKFLQSYIDSIISNGE